MNATNGHMFEGVDPQPVSCDPLARKKGYKSLHGKIMGHKRCGHVLQCQPYGGD